MKVHLSEAFLSSTKDSTLFLKIHYAVRCLLIALVACYFSSAAASCPEMVINQAFIEESFVSAP